MPDIIRLKQLKLKLNDYIVNGDIAKAQEIIRENNLQLSNNADIQNVLSIVEFLKGDLRKAEEILVSLFNKFEFNFDINYNLAIIYMNMELYEKSLVYFIRAMCIDSTKTELVMNDIKSLLDENKVTIYDLNRIKKKVIAVFTNYLKEFPRNDEGESYIGNISNIENNSFATGIYDYYFAERDGLFKEYLNNVASIYKLEMLPSNKNKLINIHFKSDSLMPIMVLNDETVLQFTVNGNEYVIDRNLVKRFYYYSFDEGDNVKIISNKEFIIGNIIELGIDEKKPKLVLNIFVDGLSQKFIEDNGLEVVMPNAYNFFKEGTICKNTYVTGEWTYVSLASFFTGMYTTNHKVFHPDYSTYSLYNKELYTEVLHKEGYFTAKIDGDWRSTPSSGYIKGIDRYLYQASIRGMHADNVINHTIEHLEAFKNKNNFMWICLPDLHDIADEFEGRISVQVNNPFHTRVFEKTQETSVRKGYDEKKIFKYGTQLKRVDTYLGLLFNYIQDNYEEGEYLVSLIADHGQGYFIEPDKFLDDGRTKVAMMFRGKNIPNGECNELIQGLDLFPIITNALDIKNINLKDGNVPKYFGGNKKREFTYTESIFPNSPYTAVINDLEHKFFFATKENCQVDGRFILDGYTFKLVNKKTQEEETEKFKSKVEKYLNVILHHIEDYIIV